MRILIDIGHPAHVHLFKYFARTMQQRGHLVLFTCRQKEYEKELLEAEGLAYHSFGKHYRSGRGKVLGLARFNLLMLRVALDFRPDVFMSHGSIYAAQVSWLLGKPHIALEDSGNMEQIRLYRPFSCCMLTPAVLPWDYGEKQIKYQGYHELAYLHPYWYTPDPSVKAILQVSDDQPYAIFRFVSWKATHDRGQKGLSDPMKRVLVDFVSHYMPVFISSEAPLPDDLKPFQLSLPPQRMHDALAFASLVISEGATMACEAGILGAPAIFASSIKTYNNLDQEKRYGSVYNISREEEIPGKIWEIMKNHHEKQGIIKKIMEDKIDVTSFLIWFVEQYPGSIRTMKENPDFQNSFR
jgi:predicted glycosyltransferase